jgi:cytoskeleton protein RodZ
MSENVDNSTDESTEAEGPRGGERLAAARRGQQIPVREIAKELHLDEAKVRALERNEFEVLGAPVFAKGHLRKYAHLVNVSEEDVFAEYYEMTHTAGLPPVVSTRPKPRQELSPGPWIAVIVVIVLAVTAYWWFTRPDAPAEPPVSEPSSSEPSSAEPVAEQGQPAPQDDSAVDPGTSDEDMLVELPVDDEPVAVEPESRSSQPVIEETESPDVLAGQVRVLLTYTGDCWTEVTDATGRRLFFNLGTDGRTVELSGAEPLSVLLGSPGNVSVLVNGDEFALPASARPDRPLRLTISGS